MEDYSDHILNYMTETEELAMDLYMQALAGNGDVKDRTLFDSCISASEHIIETLLKRHESIEGSTLKVVQLIKTKK